MRGVRVGAGTGLCSMFCDSVTGGRGGGVCGCAYFTLTDCVDVAVEVG